MGDYDLTSRDDVLEFIQDYLMLWANRRMSFLKGIALDSSVNNDIVTTFLHYKKDVENRMTSTQGLDNHKIAAILAKSIMHHSDRYFVYDGVCDGTGMFALDAVAYVICMVCAIDFDHIVYNQSIKAGMMEFIGELKGADNLLSASFVIYLLEKSFPE